MKQRKVLAEKLMMLILGIILLGMPAAADVPAGGNPGDSSAPISAREYANLIDHPDQLNAWRKRAENILKDDEDSYCGHALMGLVMHRSEGDLPRSRYHLKEARRLAKKVARREKKQDAVMFYGLCSHELMIVLEEMDCYQECIDIIDECFDTVPSIRISKVWPLMKLDREDEAREELKKAFNSGDIAAKIMAWNSLGALESELGHRQASYNAFKSLISEGARYGIKDDPTFYSNTGEAALALGFYDEAERYFRKAASCPFQDTSYTNPYQHLTELYLTEGRFAEAFSSAQKMHQWSRATKPFLYQQSMAENTKITGELLLDLGYINEAVDNLSFLVKRPDRRGGTSTDIDQSEAGNLIIWRKALLMQEHMLQEEIACEKTFSPSWWRLLYRRLLVSFDIKTAGEKAAAIMASHNRIKESLRPYNAASVSIGESDRPMVVDIIGAGICAAALTELEDHPSESFILEEPFYQVMHAEIAMQTGSLKKAKAYFEKALEKLPKAEVPLRSYCQAALGKICDKTGNRDEALNYYETVLETCPTMLRLLDCQIPVAVQGASNSTIRKACDMIYKSPRFKKSSNGFNISIALSGSDLVASLTSKNGTVLARASVPLEKSSRKSAKNLVKELHRQVLSPKVSLSQTDLNSLDGSNRSGSTASDSLKNIFSDQEPGERI
ncbi:MAG: tetratricopeptide repeat protein [bacterium]|nr:tetratricopeptide repeat protein [bacterium]